MRNEKETEKWNSIVLSFSSLSSVYRLDFGLLYMPDYITNHLRKPLC